MSASPNEREAIVAHRRAAEQVASSLIVATKAYSDRLSDFARVANGQPADDGEHELNAVRNIADTARQLAVALLALSPLPTIAGGE